MFGMLLCYLMGNILEQIDDDIGVITVNLPARLFSALTGFR